MARKINLTPTLSGIDAELFIERLNSPSTPEEIESLKRADEVLKKLNIFVN
ncbi:hypothetical protein [Methanobrevibacter millerae]|uniref:Uncharacterized protein n=1 Tax=Methanobrevibacter millerae TaxID=230361 RepID=A0A1G5XTA9_9EURY|nr:hypothetical protein [Methanobrevibacter millerae]SDA73166.1 hypothetical protein SAMN02910315_02445 [Methanobrevibacter millerae]